MGGETIQSWIMVVATVTYTVGTFLLWKTTRKTVQAMREAFKLNFLQAYQGSPGPSTGVPPVDMHEQEQWKDRERRFQELLERVFPELIKEIG